MSNGYASWLLFPASCCASIAAARSAAAIALPKRTAHPAPRPGVQALLARARQTGPHFGQLCQGLHERYGAVAVRRMQGMFGLVKKYGVATVEQACTLALQVNLPEYQFVKRSLEHQEPFPLTLQQVDPLIRELTVYRDVIQARLDFSAGEEDPS